MIEKRTRQSLQGSHNTKHTRTQVIPPIRPPRLPQTLHRPRPQSVNSVTDNSHQPCGLIQRMAVVAPFVGRTLRRFLNGARCNVQKEDRRVGCQRITRAVRSCDQACVFPSAKRHQRFKSLRPKNRAPLASKCAICSLEQAQMRSLVFKPGTKLREDPYGLVRVDEDVCISRSHVVPVYDRGAPEQRFNLHFRLHDGIKFCE